MRRILIVTRDLMPFRGLHPIATELQKLGHTITVWADPDGKSKLEWEKSDTLFTMIEDTNQERVILDTNPSIVLVGLSSPIGIEDQVTAVANRSGIPVVAFSDTWGATSRMKLGQPDLILTVDNIDKQIALEHFLCADAVNVGDWITKPVTNPKNVWSPGMKSMLIAGQNPATIKDFVIEALARIDEKSNWQVAFRPHPKYKDTPETLEALALLKHHQVNMLEDQEVSGDDLASTADVTVSSFSGVLRVAALAGKIAISVQTESCVAQMMKSTGLRTFPLCDAKLCLEIGKGADTFNIADLIREQSERSNRETLASEYAAQTAPRLELAITEILRLSI